VISSPFSTSGSIKRGDSRSGLEIIFSFEDDKSLTELKSEINTSISCFSAQILLMRILSALILLRTIPL
jgi:hypothetical protein